MNSYVLTLLTIGAVHSLAVMSPGPSFLLTARTAVAQSRAAGLKVALGLGIGTILWAVAAILGLNYLFRQFVWLFVAMKFCGALFLLWIAWQIFRHAGDAIAIEDGGSDGSDGHSPVLSGFLMQISNPKVAVFFGSIFIAMLPGEVPGWMVVALIAIVTFNEVAWYSLVSLFFAAEPVRRFYLAAKSVIDRTTGAFLGVLGLRLLWQAGDAA